MKNKRTKSNSVLYAVVVGVITSILLSLIFILLATIFIQNEYLDIISASLIANVALFLSVLVGTQVGAVCLNEGKWRACVGISAIYYVATLCLGIVCFDGIGSNCLIGFAVCAVAALIGIFVCNTRNKQNFHKRKKR